MAKKDKRRYEELIVTSDMDEREIEDVIRARIQWRQRKWRQIMGNLPAFIIVNAILWGSFRFNGMGFPWPIFITFFWGMSLVKDAWELFQASNNMQSRRDEYVRQEVEREKARLGIYSEKPKRFTDRNGRWNQVFLRQITDKSSFYVKGRQGLSVNSNRLVRRFQRAKYNFH